MTCRACELDDELGVMVTQPKHTCGLYLARTLEESVTYYKKLVRKELGISLHDAFEQIKQGKLRGTILEVELQGAYFLIYREDLRSLVD